MKTKWIIPIIVMLLALSMAPVVQAQSGGEGENGDESPGENYFCQNPGEQHPVGARIAENYQIPYEEVMGWFCGGLGFGQIKQALQISTVTGISPVELLQMKTDEVGWGEIRRELGLTGHPDGNDETKDKPPGNGKQKLPKHHGRPPWAGRPGGPWGGGPPFPFGG